MIMCTQSIETKIYLLLNYVLLHDFLNDYFVQNWMLHPISIKNAKLTVFAEPKAFRRQRVSLPDAKLFN